MGHSENTGSFPPAYQMHIIQSEIRTCFFPSAGKHFTNGPCCHPTAIKLNPKAICTHPVLPCSMYNNTLYINKTSISYLQGMKALTTGGWEGDRRTQEVPVLSPTSAHSSPVRGSVHPHTSLASLQANKWSKLRRSSLTLWTHIFSSDMRYFPMIFQFSPKMYI